MKHDSTQFWRGLPDAPLAMPKQTLERHVSLFAAVRAIFASLPRFQVRG